MTQREETSRVEIDVREWYDFIGHLADVLPSLHMGGSKATRDLLDMCQLEGQSRVLDVGCGSGHTACEIARKYGSRVIGIDVSEIMIAKAREKAREQGLEDKVEFRVADTFQLPFDDGSFDVVVIESVLTPLRGDKKKALKEMIRVIQPGGMVGANEGFFDSSAPPELLELLAEHPAFHGHFTPQKLRSLFEESGLQVVQMIEVRGTQAPSIAKEVGVRGILSFMIRSYWKMLGKLLIDSRFRKAQKIDGRVTKMIKKHGGYVLIIGQKPLMRVSG